MDRSVLEGDPHAVLEGMIIAGLCHWRQAGFYLLPGRISPGHQTLADRHRTGQGEGFSGQEDPGQ